MEDRYQLLMSEVDRQTYEVEAWEQNIDNMQKEVAMKQLEHEQVLSSRVCARPLQIDSNALPLPCWQITVPACTGSQVHEVDVSG